MKSLKDYIQESKKKKALYIHGLGSDKNSSTFNVLKSSFPEFDWYTDTFSLVDPDKTMKQINTILSKGIQIVVASSFGAFYALMIQDSLAKIVVNPCMKPSIEIPKLDTEIDTDKFKKLEEDLYSNVDGEMRMCTYGVFGNRDELFNYQHLFAKVYGKDMIKVSGGHRLDGNVLASAVHQALSYFDKVNNVLKESVVNEHFINVVMKDEDADVDKYANEVWDILQASYAPIGGLLGCDDVEMLKDDSDFWKLSRKNGKIVAVAIYTFKRGGRKMMYGGTDGTVEGKTELYRIISDDVRLKDRRAWVEVSGKMEHIYQKQGATPIPALTAQLIMKDKKFVNIHDDGYHYDRVIGGEVHTKIMMGNPDKI